MRFFTLYLTAIFLLLCTVTAWSQNYAVRSTVQLMPPYSVYLSDYATAGNDKLRVILQQGDLSRPVYQLRLVMTVELNGRVIMRTSRFFNPAPIALDPGVPTVISGAELAPYVDSRNIDFIGYSKEQYEKTKALPEGSFQITFTAYDYRRQDQQVSNAGSAFYYLAKNEVPLINLPACGSKIPVRTPQQIVFSWMPRNTSSPTSVQETEYEFSLYETRPVGRNPNDVVLTSQPVFRIRTDLTQIIYGPAEPMLLDSMVYVWRVQAIDRSGKDAFRNNGYSEVCTFKYGGTDPNFDIGIVKGLQAIGETDQRAKIWWQPSDFDAYRVYYKKSGSQWQWFFNEVTKTEFKIFDLEPNNEYEVRVQGKKNGYYSPFTEIVKFRTREKTIAQCGDPAIVAKELGNPLQLALTGMTFKASDHDVTFIDVQNTGQPGWFKGTGSVFLPMLGGTYYVYFDRLYVNENREATGGRMHVASEGIAKMIEEQLGAQKDRQQKANQEQWAGTDFYEDIVEFNYAIKDIDVDASGNLVITKQNGQTVTNTEVPAILAKYPDKAVILQEKGGDQYVVQKDKATGQTEVTKVNGGGLSPETTIQDNQVKNAIVVLVLEQFEEEIDAWLRVNGKGGEADDEVLLALELPESFPKEAVFLKHLNDRVIPGFKEHPEKLIAKAEAEQSKKELLDRVTKLFKTKADIDWKKIENNDQQSVRNAIAKSLIDLSGGEIDLAAVANVAPDCGLKHAGKDKPNGSIYLIEYPEVCTYMREGIVAYYIAKGYSKYLCAKERFNLIKCLATGFVDGENENAIITLIRETPRDHAGSLLALLKADNTGVLKNLNSGIDGDNYIAVFKAIQQVYLIATDKVQIDAEVKKIDDAFLSDKSRAEKAKQNYFTWFEGGVLKAIFSDAAVFNRFDNVTISNNGVVSFKYATDPTQHDKTTTSISIEPFKLVGLKVVGGSNEVADAAQGSTVYIPAIMLPVLISKRGTADFLEALNATMVASGVGSIVTGATRFVIVSGGIDVLLGSSALVVDNYKDEISRMKHGENFLNAYILVNKAVLVYFGSKTILQLAGAIPKLKSAYDALKSSDDFAKLKTTNSTKAQQIEKEVQAALTKSDDAIKNLLIDYEKVGVEKAVNLTGFVAKNSDQFIDVIVHFSNGKFKILVEEGSGFAERTLETEQLAAILNRVSGSKSFRLLSCNDIAAAQELSAQLKGKPLYASHGWVDLYTDGTIQSQYKFQKLVNGEALLPEVAMDGSAGSGVKSIRLGEQTLASAAGRRTLKAKDASKIGSAGSTIKIELIDEAGNLVGELKRVPGSGKEFNYYFTDYNGATGVIKNKQYVLQSKSKIITSTSPGNYSVPSGQNVLYMDFNLPKNISDNYRGLGNMMFDDAFTYYNRSNKIDGIYGEWIKSTDLYQDYGGISVNLKRFQDALNSGITREEAAFKTVTGEWALLKQFGKVKFVEGIYKPESRVEVIFYK